MARAGWSWTMPVYTGSPPFPPAPLLPVAYAMAFAWRTHEMSLLKKQPGPFFSRRTSFCTHKIYIRQFPRRVWGDLHSLCINVPSPAHLCRWLPLASVGAQEKRVACFQQTAQIQKQERLYLLRYSRAGTDGGSRSQRRIPDSPH